MRTDLSDFIELCLLSTNPALIETGYVEFDAYIDENPDISHRLGVNTLSCVLPNSLAYRLIPFCNPPEFVEIPKFDQKTIRKIRKKYKSSPFGTHFDFNWDGKKYIYASIERIHECGDCRTCYVEISALENLMV